MKELTYKSYDDLPLFLNAEIIAKVLGVSPASAYELMHEDGFPTLSVGNRKGAPSEIQRIDFAGERSSGMSKLCRLRRSEGYGTCDDEVSKESFIAWVESHTQRGGGK